MFRFSTVLATLLGCASLIAPPALLGQSSPSDTAAPAETQTARADSAWVTGVYHAPDTTRQPTTTDTTGTADTTQATQAATDTLGPAGPGSAPASPDTSRVAGRDTIRANADPATRDTAPAVAPGPAGPRESDTTSASAASADSILIAACRGNDGATVAPDLLVVVFAPNTEAGDRAAVANAVDGKLLGPVNEDPGAYYLRLPTGGEEFRLKAAADQLIQLTPVRQVGSRACPPRAVTQ